MKNKDLINLVIACLSVTFSISATSQNHNTQTNHTDIQETSGDIKILYHKTLNESTANNIQILQQQKEDADTFMILLELMTKTGLQKKEINPAIKCKNCTNQYMSIGTLEGCLMMWAIEAISKGHSEFEKIKKLLEEYIKLLSDETSIEELKDFIFNTANDMKQACFGCKKIAWQK